MKYSKFNKIINLHVYILKFFNYLLIFTNFIFKHLNLISEGRN